MIGGAGELDRGTDEQGVSRHSHDEQSVKHEGSEECIIKGI